MTIENMFPPPADERCQIIQFSTAARISPKRGKTIVRAAGSQEPEPPARDEGELTVTCQNKRLRDRRRDAWREADTIREYWKARLDFQSAVSWAQQMGVPEGRDHPADPEDRDRGPNVKRWRAALVRQLLTPAPDVAAIAWKRAALKSGQHEHTDVKTERIERAIADDVAFLTSHPTRTKGLRKMAGELDPPNEGGEANA